MAYRATKKAQKLWSENANKAKARKTLAHGERRPMIDDDFIRIEISRKLTGEHAVFELFAGNRSDNYTVYCNDKLLGVMGITKVSEGIRKALPRCLSEASIYS